MRKASLHRTTREDVSSALTRAFNRYVTSNEVRKGIESRYEEQPTGMYGVAGVDRVIYKGTIDYLQIMDLAAFGICVDDDVYIVTVRKQQKEK